MIRDDFIGGTPRKAGGFIWCTDVKIKPSDIYSELYSKPSNTLKLKIPQSVDYGAPVRWDCNMKLSLLHNTKG